MHKGPCLYHRKTNYKNPGPKQLIQKRPEISQKKNKITQS